MAEPEILELYDLSFSDLILISSDRHHTPPTARAKILEALGPTGPGLLSVSGVSDAAGLRRDLPLARGLALLDPDRRKCVLKEQNLGTDVPLKNPGRNVSSFAMQLRYERDSIADVNEVEVVHSEYEGLGRNLKKLGFLMMDIGLRIARVCDSAIGEGPELEKSLVESSAAKGRLIHYHSELDRRVLTEQQGRREKRVNSKCERGGCEARSELWQQWHYDYGIFTVLTAPLFLTHRVVDEGEPFRDSCGERCDYLDGHTHLQIFDPTKKEVFSVKACPESFIVQVGESAEVISKGKLRATLHSVAGPGKLEGLSRETYVVFLQPAWDKVMSYTYDTAKRTCLEDESVDRVSNEDERSIERILKIVPPLSTRLKDGMTFAEFSRVTTRQYYGGTGLQSNR